MDGLKSNSAVLISYGVMYIHDTLRNSNLDIKPQITLQLTIDYPQ